MSQLPASNNNPDLESRVITFCTGLIFHFFPTACTVFKCAQYSYDHSLLAIYIDLEDESKDGDNRQYSRWSELPDLLLEKIFSYLSIREKYYCSLVCKSWYRAFYLPYVWSQFVLEDSTLTRGRFNYYSGWQVRSFSVVLFFTFSLSINLRHTYFSMFSTTYVRKCVSHKWARTSVTSPSSRCSTSTICTNS